MIPRLCKYPDCERYTENENVNYCGSHGAQLRKEERQSLKDSLKVKKPIKKESARRKKERPIYSKLREEQLEEKPDCQLKLQGCTNLATQCHHSAKRGKNYLNKETFLSACDNCHDLAEFHMSAKDRREQGFLKTV